MDIEINKESIIDFLIVQNEFQGSPKMLSRLLGCPASIVSKCLHELIEDGFIEYQVAPNGGYSYRIKE